MVGFIIIDFYLAEKLYLQLNLLDYIVAKYKKNKKIQFLRFILNFFSILNMPEKR